MKTRLLHVRVNVSNLSKAIDWYQSVLNFKVAALWPDDNPHYAHFESEEGAIFAIAEERVSPSPGRYNFYTTELDNLWKRLKANAGIVEELFVTPYGMRKFTIRDLDGNELRFIER